MKGLTQRTHFMQLSRKASACSATTGQKVPFAFHLTHRQVGLISGLVSPFVGTPPALIRFILDLLPELKKRDILMDLGCGDGNFVIKVFQMSQTLGRAIGVELDGSLLEQARQRVAEESSIAGRGERVIEFRHQDLFQTELNEANILVVFLLPSALSSLKEKLANWLDRKRSDYESEREGGVTKAKDWWLVSVRFPLDESVELDWDSKYLARDQLILKRDICVNKLMNENEGENESEHRRKEGADKLKNREALANILRPNTPDSQPVHLTPKEAHHIYRQLGVFLYQ